MKRETRQEIMTSALTSYRSSGLRNILLFVVVAIIWLSFDRFTKSYCDGNYYPGEIINDSFSELVRFVLVHNTGAAWGLFGDSTTELAILSVIVCAIILFYFIIHAPKANVGETLGLAIVIAGGIGNAIDRFTLGYVVDFIEFGFISFPVFNVADIGVTCGFVIFLISMLLANKETPTQKVPKHGANT